MTLPGTLSETLPVILRGTLPGTHREQLTTNNYQLSSMAFSLTQDAREVMP